MLDYRSAYTMNMNSCTDTLKGCQNILMFYGELLCRRCLNICIRHFRWTVLVFVSVIAPHFQQTFKVNFVTQENTIFFIGGGRYVPGSSNSSASGGFGADPFTGKTL